MTHVCPVALPPAVQILKIWHLFSPVAGRCRWGADYHCLWMPQLRISCLTWLLCRSRSLCVIAVYDIVVAQLYKFTSTSQPCIHSRPLVGLNSQKRSRSGFSFKISCYVFSVIMPCTERFKHKLAWSLSFLNGHMVIGDFNYLGHYSSIRFWQSRSTRAVFKIA